MKRRIWIFVLISLLVFSSCTYPGTPPTDLPLTTPTQNTLPLSLTSPTSTFVPIETLLAVSDLSSTPTLAATSTPRVTLASPRQQPVNCRVGPDISYAVIGALNVGNQAEVIGKNIDITWIYVRNPSDPSTNCWLSVDFINLDGSVDLMPVVGPPEIMVTDIQVSVVPAAVNVACDAFPQNVVINAQLTTNGPAIVTWYWESSIGQTSPQKQILFEAGTSKSIQDYYQVDRAGDYVIQIKTVLPNPMAGQANFKITCTP